MPFPFVHANKHKTIILRIEPPTKKWPSTMPRGGARVFSIAPLLCFGLMGLVFVVGNYAGVMGVIESYAMGATFLITLVKWVDWLRS